MQKHPAKFSKALYEPLAQHIQGSKILLDPFAGIGNIHLIAEIAEVPLSIGVELEPEWCLQWKQSENRINIVGDSTKIDEIFEELGLRPDCICTSVVYGNRMSDHHVAKDNSKRNTYTHTLGRQLTDNNAGKMEFAKNGKYESLHMLVWQKCFDILAKNGKLVLNISDFLRTRKQPGPRSPLKDYETVVEMRDNGKMLVCCEVSKWHKDTLEGLGFIFNGEVKVPTRRQKQGANRDVRVEYESILSFNKP